MDLNQKQKEAISSTKGPVLIVAGAGTGKTRTITQRIIHLVKNGVRPSSILAITFTNKAAEEMKNRTFGELGSHTPEVFKESIKTYDDSPFIGTFHALGAKIIRENARHFGLIKHFSIFDRDDSKKLIKESLKEVGSTLDLEPSLILELISREKNNLGNSQELKNRSELENNPVLETAAKVWEKYEEKLKSEGALDFDDLILKSVNVLKTEKNVLEHYQNLWHYIHVDEYQDTNKVQYEMVRLLSEKNKNICVVGDIDQNVYSWRGSTIKNIMSFEKDYPEAKTIILEENYRSTKNILKTANEIIKKNKFRIEKNLFTGNSEGEKISLIVSLSEVEEAKKVAQKSGELIEQGINPKEISVLYRANFQSRVLEEAFLMSGIPYQVVGLKFLERREVKDIISYIRAALNPNSFSDFKRIANLPARGIGKVTLLKIIEGRENEIPKNTAIKVKELKNLLEEIKKQSEIVPPGELVKFILKKSRLEEMLKKGGDDGKERLANILELANLALKYRGLEPSEAIERFLSDISLATEQDAFKEEEKSVKLMTIHASKGLEFEYVFITGLEEGLFPFEREKIKSEEDKEEERRLFYVALTRAKKKVFLSYAQTRSIFGSRIYSNPSEFLLDIDPEMLEQEETLSPLEENSYDINF